MNLRCQARVSGLVLRCICLLVLCCQIPIPAGAQDGSSDGAIPSDVISGPTEAEKQQMRAQLTELGRMEALQRTRAQFEAKGEEIRAQLRATKSRLWSLVISTNSPTYLKLRQAAAASATRSTRCTICGGSGTLNFCVLCENSGKCITCDGVGARFAEPCATCHATGRCFLCRGSGKMPCPFCDDGTIDLDLPPPSPQISDPPIITSARLAEIDLRWRRTAPTTSPPQPTQATEASPAANEEQNAPPPGTDYEKLAFVAVVTLAGALAVRKLGPMIAEFLNSRDPWISTPVGRSGSRPEVVPELPELALFFSDLRAALNPHTRPAETPSVLRDRTSAPLNEKRHQPSSHVDDLHEQFDRALAQIAKLRNLLAGLGRATESGARRKLLGELAGHAQNLREDSQLAAPAPRWLLTTALIGLLKQLAAKESNLTASVLRTVAGAIDLLEKLSVPSLNADLGTNPPVRLLAVDDDPICRQGLSLALKKAFPDPDLASNSEAALELAARRPYDVIFLDVEMPGMDGFELCAKIRENTANRSTSVVFVTSHGDFNSRARSALTGAEELIGKPFLSFELAVKALTLALRGRLGLGSENRISRIQNAKSEPVVARKAAAPVPCPHPASRTAVAAEKEQPSDTAARLDSISEQVSSDYFPAAGEPGPRDFAKRMPTQASRHIGDFQQRLQAIQQASEPAALNDVLGELYVYVHGLTEEAERGELRAVYRLGFTLEGMLKKLLEKPGLRTPSTLNATAAALELLEQLTREGIEFDLSRPPIRLLVVDDDPLSRRAICGALQLVFVRPESADSGEAAVALATEKSFDLIFLDVMMPGMDGFTACEKIREADLNKGTPVVFVTSRGDVGSRAQAMAAGGCGFIPKPVLSSEIMLTALTHILRTRINQSNKSEQSERVEVAAC